MKRGIVAIIIGALLVSYAGLRIYQQANNARAEQSELDTLTLDPSNMVRRAEGHRAGETRQTPDLGQRVTDVNYEVDLTSPYSPREEAAIEVMTQTLIEFGAEPSRSSEDLMQVLNQTEQSPRRYADLNDVTGGVHFVRTHSPLPGTRYLHGQFTLNEDNTDSLEYLSIEFRPGPQAMEYVIAQVNRLYPDLGKPEMISETFAKWRLDSGFDLWVRKMELEDLQSNPFNAYTTEDVGTIEIGIAMDHHDHLDDEEHDHHHRGHGDHHN